MPKARIEKIPQEKLDLLEEVSTNHFGQFGFEGASFNRIIAASGMSKGAIYYAFEDKKDLYSWLVGNIISELNASFPSNLSYLTNENYWQEFELSFLKILNILNKYEGGSQILTSMRSYPGINDRNDLLNQLVQITFLKLRSLLDRGVKIGEVELIGSKALTVNFIYKLIQASSQHIDEQIARNPASSIERLTSFGFQAIKKLLRP